MKYRKWKPTKGMMIKRTLIISDLQIPYHHRIAVTKLIEFTKWWKPDIIACVGDESDQPQVSQWTNGLAGEYAQTLMRDITETRNVLQAFRHAAPDAQFMVQRSNHTDRLDKYIARKAPALAHLESLKYEHLVGFNQLGIQFNKKMTEILPGVVMGHGDEYQLSNTAGMTAYKLMQTTGKSVVIGHPHRLGLVYESKGHSGNIRTTFALESGNLMNMASNGASYLKPRGAANWQLGFGLIESDGKHHFPQVVPMRKDGGFTWGGKSF